MAIRSALVIGNALYAYAGCGVVGDSDADAEYEETNNKMRTILDAL
nr:chorismate-binding protein [Veillonella denticariosi]